MAIKTIGIIGAGKLGITLARIARRYNFDVNIAGSGDPEKIKLTAEVLAPGTKAMTIEDVAKHSDVIVLAMPLGKFRTLPKQAFAGKLVIDAMNYWWEVDGELTAIIQEGQTSSEAVQEYLADSRVVKAINHMGYHDLFDEHKSKGSEGRKAIAIAGNDDEDVKAVSALVDALGFDPLPIGALHEGAKLEPGMPAFGANLPIEELKNLVEK